MKVCIVLHDEGTYCINFTANDKHGQKVLNTLLTQAEFKFWPGFDILFPLQSDSPNILVASQLGVGVGAVGWLPTILYSPCEVHRIASPRFDMDSGDIW